MSDVLVMTVEELHTELQRCGKIPASTNKPDLQKALLKASAEPPTVMQDQYPMASTVWSDPRDEDPHLQVGMSSGLTAGSTDTQLELRWLEMAECHMTMDLEARKLETEEHRLAVEAEERARQQELEAEECREQWQHEFEIR